MDIRLLEARDCDLLRGFFLAQDAETIRQRFAGPISVEAVRAYVDRRLAPGLTGTADQEVFVLGAFRDGGRLIGVAEVHLIRPGDGGLTAELAFLVDSQNRNVGLGKTLMAAAHGVARHRGTTQIVINTQRSNHRMRRLAATMGLTQLEDAEMDWVAGRPVESDEAGTVPSLVSFPGLLALIEIPIFAVPLESESR
jgi:GNAT superfamily N-acetyltransferase